MPKFSKASKTKLSQLHPDLQDILKTAIECVNFKIVCGYRDQDVQVELYEKGRRFDTNLGKWIVTNQKKVVTNCDGYKKKSKHNVEPSQAVDIMPYFRNAPHIDWKKEALFDICFLIGYIQSVADSYGIKIRVGCKWNKNTIRDNQFRDFPHIELV